MAGYTITSSTTIQNLRNAKKIYEKLNNANPKPNPQQKAQNDAAIAHAESAEKHIENVRKKYAQVYPDVEYLSSAGTMLSLAGIENALTTEGVTLDSNDRSILNQVIGAEKPGWKANAKGLGKAFFTDKDGKFSTCKLEVAGVGTAAAGLIANKTVGGFILNKVLPLVGKAIAAIWGFSPITAIGLGIFAGAKLFSLGKKLIGPLVTKVQQQKAYNAEMEKANNEAQNIGTPENHDATRNLFEQRLINISSQLADPAKKADAQKDLFRVLMEIRDAGPDVLNETEKQQLISFVKNQNAFAGITKTGDGLKERFTNSAPARGGASSEFNTKVAAVKTAISKLNAGDQATVAAVETAISEFKAIAITGTDAAARAEAEKLREILIAQFQAELEYAKAKKLDASKIQAVHNKTAEEFDVETEMKI